MGRVLSTDENRYGGLLSLSASALSEPGCCQLRGSTQLPPRCPHPVQGMARARPANNAQAPYHLPVASGAPLTRLPRDRGNGGSWSREGSRPAQRWSLGLNLVYNDPELQIRQRPSFPLASLICFGNFISGDLEIFKLAIKVVFGLFQSQGFSHESQFKI